MALIMKPLCYGFKTWKCVEEDCNVFHVKHYGLIYKLCLQYCWTFYSYLVWRAPIGFFFFPGYVPAPPLNHLLLYFCCQNKASCSSIASKVSFYKFQRKREIPCICVYCVTIIPCIFYVEFSNVAMVVLLSYPSSLFSLSCCSNNRGMISTNV